MSDVNRVSLEEADFDRCFEGEPHSTDPGEDLARGRRARRVRNRRRWFGAAATMVITAVAVIAAPSWVRGPQLAVPAGPAEHVLPSWPGCAAAGAFDGFFIAGPPPATEAIPSKFNPLEVRSCTQIDRKADNGDQVLVNAEQKAPVTAELLAYLAQPSVTAGDPDQVYCRGVLITPPWLVLVDQDGRYVAPTVPTDDCHTPLQHDDPGGPPYDKLDYREVSADQVRVLESVAAREAKCPMAHKNMVVFEPAAKQHKGIDVDWFGDTPVRRCDYETNPTEPETGTFITGGRLPPSEVAALLKAADKNRENVRDADCTTAATRFTVLLTPNDLLIGYIEADGCRRILLDR